MPLIDEDALLSQFPELTRIDKFFQIFSPTGTITIRSPNIRQHDVPLSRPALEAAFTGSTVFESARYPNEPPLRLVSVPIIYRGSLLYIVQVGTTLEGVEETLRRFLLVLLVMAVRGRVPSAREVTPEGVSRRAGVVLTSVAVGWIGGVAGLLALAVVQVALRWRRLAVALPLAAAGWVAWAVSSPWPAQGATNRDLTSGFLALVLVSAAVLWRGAAGAPMGPALDPLLDQVPAEGGYGDGRQGAYSLVCGRGGAGEGAVPSVLGPACRRHMSEPAR